MNHQNISKNLHSMVAERFKHGWSIHDVATFADVSERAIKKYEAGLQFPTRSVYNRLARIFSWEAWA